MRVGQAFGRFDLLHYGHARMMDFCASRCDRLRVGVATDDYCNSLGLPVARSFGDRAALIYAMKGVDSVFAYAEHNPLILWQTRPTEIIFLNPEHLESGDEIYAEVLEKLKELAEVIWIPRTPNINGTDIRKKLRELKR
jgi:glycerol-3-phosphate cytidylyltransferase